jgi:hypothetical protein
MPSLMETTFRRRGAALAPGEFALALALAFGAMSPAWAQADHPPYPNRAPLEQYRVASRADEIALARSAAPASISSRAEVLTLGAVGYQTAVKGDNGFVCLVLRAWASGFGDAGFWNPKMRAPICYNPAAARSVLPTDLRRAQWALAGVSKAEMVERTKAAIAAQVIVPPEIGAMSYMLSKDGYLNDRDGHWHPHLMFFLPRMAPAQWGANLAGAGVNGDESSLEPLTVFFVPVPHWSDGTSGTMGM